VSPGAVDAGQHCDEGGVSGGDGAPASGSGIPTMGNVHEVVARHRHHATVAYVERDAVAVLGGRRLLAEDPRTVYVDADVRQVDRVLSHPGCSASST